MMLVQLVAAIALFLMCSTAMAADPMPPGAIKYMPMLVEEIDSAWPDMPLRSSMAAQIEQETCVTLRHGKCWNPRAELKTAREYGFGLGQCTVTAKFNCFEELRGMDIGMKSWKWEDRYDPRMQLRGLVAKDKYNYDRMPGDGIERLAFAYASYNGGIGGVLSDIKLCRATKGCDANKWFGNVENTSMKAKVAVKGYGKPFFLINREYPANNIGMGEYMEINRRQKYIPFMDGGPIPGEVKYE